MHLTIDIDDLDDATQEKILRADVPEAERLVAEAVMDKLTDDSYMRAMVASALAQTAHEAASRMLYTTEKTIMSKLFQQPAFRTALEKIVLDGLALAIKAIQDMANEGARAQDPIRKS